MPADHDDDTTDRLAAAGLLDGVQGTARSARIELLRSLLDDGATTAELREAVAQERLVLLPLERALRAQGPRSTPREVAERLGWSLTELGRLRETLGLAAVEPDDPALGPADVVALEHARVAVEAGLPFEGVLEVNAALATSMPGLAATLRQLGAATIGAEDDEHAAALALAAAARDLLPLLMPVLEYALRSHVEHQVVGDFVDAGLGALAGGPAGSPRCVAFADLEGFTRFSERSAAGAVGALNDRLAATARGLAAGRVRLVKTVGDAAVLTAPTPGELLPAVLELVERVERDPSLTRLHVGVAHGEVLQRAGDLFGRPVNRASRLSDLAEPGSVICDEATREQLDDDALDLAELPAAAVRGVAEPMRVWRVRRVRHR